MLGSTAPRSAGMLGSTALRSAGMRGSATPRSSVLPISRARPSSKIASFSDCQFGRTTSFREARFQGAFPRFSGAILHQNTIFTAKDRFWPAMSSVEPEASRDSLAVIRHAIAKQGLPEEEHYFFRREMRFRAKIGTVFERLPYILYQELSDFGNSIIRPTVGLLVLWVTFGLAYWLGYYGQSKFETYAACLRTLFCQYFRLPWIPRQVHAECLRQYPGLASRRFRVSVRLWLRPSLFPRPWPACAVPAAVAQCRLNDGRRPTSLWRRSIHVSISSVVTDARPAVGARCQ